MRVRPGKDTRLRAAEVPVHALIHRSVDPTVEFPETFPLQIAVYWSKPDDILGLIHALHETGLPFFVTRDLDRALQHRLVIIYPSADAQTFTETQDRELTMHVEAGGSLFAVNIFAGALQELFGFRGFQPSRRRYRLDFAFGQRPGSSLSESS